jgi:phosphopantothenoylcysteine decarboxylase/phosphopantothenate--cysteine ligase
MAESGEVGVGRMAEPLDIARAAATLLSQSSDALKGLRVIVTSGPTHEPIDPVRYIANRSSGKQGHAIAEAAAAAGAVVTLISGPVTVADPPGVRVVKVERARDMLRAAEAAQPSRTGGPRQTAARRSRSPARRRPHWRWSKTPTSSRPSRGASRGGHSS